MSEKKDKEDFMEVARSRFKKSVDARSVNVTSQIDDLRFLAGSPDNGWQWPDSLKKLRENDPNGQRPCLTINKLPEHVRQITNSQRQNRPAIKVLPVDDKSDPEVAEILQGVVRHIEINSDAEVAYDTACENQVAHGEGFFRVITDYCTDDSFEQDILIRRIRNSFSVYMDPDIQDPTGMDQKWCFITDMLPEDEFKSQYPDAEPIEWGDVGQGDDYGEWFTTDKQVRIAEYFCFKTESKTIYQLPDGSVTDQEPPQGVQVLNSREAKVKKVHWSTMNGQEVLKESEWAGKYIPVIRVVGNEFDVEGRLVISGIVRNAKDAQRMYNYWKSQETEMLALAPKAPFMAAVEAVEGFEDRYQEANLKNFSYLPYNAFTEEGLPIPAPTRSMPPMPQQGILQAALGAADDIKGATGQYNPALGNSEQTKSGIALRTEQSRSDTGTFHYIDNLSRSIRHCGRILIDLIPKIYDTRRVARIIGEDDEPDQAILDPSITTATQSINDAEGNEIGKIYNPSIGRYDVAIAIGPSFTTKRQEAFQAMSEIVQGNPALWGVIGDLIVKNMDWPGAQEMSDRIKKTIDPKILEEGPSPELQQATQVIKQLEGQMQKMAQSFDSQKVTNDRMRVEIDAFKAETERMKEVSKMMTPEQVQALVMSTLNGLLTSSDISQDVQQGVQDVNAQPEPQPPQMQPTNPMEM